MPSSFHEQDISSRLKDRRALSKFLDEIFKARRPDVRKARLNYIFMSDEALHKINVEFLDHDDYTDIITFEMSEDKKIVEGEIYISVERVAENAKKFESEYQRELHRVIFHGALHLCGLGDKKPEDQKRMRAAEDECLNAWYSRTAK
jgi:rRNA maturation RNase YbeY